MPSVSTDTMLKMLENLPEDIQDGVLEHLREYMEDIKEEMIWNDSFSKSQKNLITAARKAKQEINKGRKIISISDEE